MRLSEERIAVIARDVCNTLLDEELIDLEIDEDRFETLMNNLLIKDFQIEDEIDEEATAWVKKHRPHVEDNTTEWDIEMEKIKEELAVSRGFVLR